MPLRVLRDRAQELRSALVADERFRRLVSRVPLLRGIARRRAMQTFDLMAGFVYSRVLVAALASGLLDRLARGTASVDECALHCELSPQAARMLLDAATALQLTERRASAAGAPRYGIGALGAVVQSDRGLRAMIEHHEMLYRDLRDPLALLREGSSASELCAYWAYAREAAPDRLPDAAVTPYSRLMSESQHLIAHELIASGALRGCRHLLDVGGGDGTFAVHALRAFPGLRVTLLDLPAVARLAQARFEREQLAARASVRAAAFLAEDWPEDCDAVSFVRVLHDHDDGVVEALLARAARALQGRRGRLVVAEPMSGVRGAERVADAYFAFYLLAMGRGRPRDLQTLRAMCERAGFAQVRPLRTPMPMQACVVVARMR